jgi:23S rRNA (pseudouridine1915-N3)-methyltransferase
MRIKLVSVGTRMPQWVEAGIEEYRKRLPREFELRIVEIPLGNRGKSASARVAMQKEGEACLKAVEKGEYLIALDVRGRSLDTEAMAVTIGALRDEGLDICLVVGGPDGLAPEVLAAARASWSLSALTFPHPLVRVILAEQLYRVWSIISGHPYHRA